MDDPAVLAAAPATSTSGRPLTHPDRTANDIWPRRPARPSLGDDCTPQALEQRRRAGGRGVATGAGVGARIPAGGEGVADG